MFLSRNKKNNVYPCNSQFYFMKVGFNGIKIILASFRDVGAGSSGRLWSGYDPCECPERNTAYLTNTRYYL